MARERYLVQAGEDTIHDPAAEKKAEQKDQTPHGKWENFWFYHKKHVIIGILVAGVVAYSIVSSLQTVKPDYEVGLIVSTPYASETSDALGTELAKYGTDRNGDGKVSVQVNLYYIPKQSDDSSAASGSTASASSSAASSSASSAASESGSLSSTTIDPQMLIAYQTKLVGDISTGSSIIFFTDDDSFVTQQSQNHLFSYVDGTTPSDTATDYDKMRVSVEKTKIADSKLTLTTIYGSTTIRAADLLKNVSVSLRSYTGSNLEGKHEADYKASKELFDKLTAAS